MLPERHETQPFRTKWTLDVKNCGKIAILRCPSQPCRAKWTLDVKNCGKTEVKLQLLRATLSHEMDVGHQKLTKNYDLTCPLATLSHEMDVERQKLR